MLARNRYLSAWIAASYVLTVAASALFHDHGCGSSAEGCEALASAEGHDSCTGDGDHKSHSSSPTAPSCPDNDHNCPVCQYLAQQTIAADDTPQVTFAAMVQELEAVAPVFSAGRTPSAWHSRAPPVPA